MAPPASLNAPSGAGCFLTCTRGKEGAMFFRLNAPSGARCFLTVALRRMDPGGGGLMHLLVLGAF